MNNILKYCIRIAIAVVCAIVSTLFTSCEKELDFEYHDIPAKTVVEGALTQDGVSVSITLTTPMDEPMNRDQITDATVTISDLSSGDILPLLPDAKGVFRADLQGVAGNDYQLTVEKDGKRYVAVSRMQPAVAVESVGFYWIKMPGDEMAALRIRFEDLPGHNDYYWERIYRNGKSYKWNVITDRGAINGIVEDVITTTHRDPEKENNDKDLIVPGDEITVSVTAIDRRMADYLMALANNSNGQVIFDGADPCLGYFLASPVTSTTLQYLPDQFGYE